LSRPKDVRVLLEAEEVSKFLLCVSSYILKGLRSHFPGLDAFFLLNLRSAGLEPEAALLFDPETYLETLTKVLGSAERTKQLLITALPKGKAFKEIAQVLISKHRRDEIEEAALAIIRKYRKDVERECSKIA